MWHSSKAPPMSLGEINSIHTDNAVAKRADKNQSLAYPVNISGFIGPKPNFDLAAQTVIDQRASGFPAQVWGNFFQVAPGK